MGIRGLESFLDAIYRSEYREQVFTMRPLSELKLAIDGNLFMHFVSSLCQVGAYGGNYDQFYAMLKLILLKMRPSIAIVIFDGAKESIEKSKHRLEQKVARVANIELQSDFYKPISPPPKHGNTTESANLSREEPESERQARHFNELLEYPALFNRTIFYELLNELGIKYAMSEHLADHAIALYACGFNDLNENYTVLSKASFFNIYNLQAGYLSTKYLHAELANIEQFDPEKTLLPVFYLKNLLRFFCFESQRTWIYFCVLLGSIFN
jgi:hypothetical protein